MGDEVWVDTTRMDIVLPQINLLATSTKGAHDGLLEALAPLIGAAGTDDAGAKTFYENYNPVRDQVTEALRSLYEVIGSMDTGVRTMIRGYTSTEENNTVHNFGGDNGGDTPPPPHPKASTGHE
jgi:hypothetical protein